MVTKYFPVLLFVMLSGSMASAGENFMITAAENLPLSIRQVSRCGVWRDGAVTGYFRVVVGDVSEGAGSELYIQLVTDPGQDTPSKLIRTFPITELNNDHAQYYFKSVECMKVGRRHQVNIVALYEHDEIERVHRFSIRMTGMTGYQLIEKSK